MTNLLYKSLTAHHYIPSWRAMFHQTYISTTVLRTLNHVTLVMPGESCSMGSSRTSYARVFSPFCPPEDPFSLLGSGRREMGLQTLLIYLRFCNRCSPEESSLPREVQY